MKKLRYLLLLMPLVYLGCKKGFLDRTPTKELTEETVFLTSENFKTYAWNLYDYFDGYGTGYAQNINQNEAYSDNLARTINGSQSPYAYQTKTLPTTGSATNSLSVASWNFTYIRSVNIMLDNIDKSIMNQRDKDHWRSVGYFFRALRYYDLLAAFGDVTWVEHALTDTSTDVLFAPRTPRAQVAKNILDNLTFAESHIKPEGDGNNTINVHVVRALLSRFGLFEGTWQKYHGLPDANMYLNVCKTFSEKLMTNFGSCMSSYNLVYNSENLSGQPGIILYKEYTAELTSHSNVRFLGSTSTAVDVTKDAVESYLCTDGKPIGSSTLYAGDQNMYTEFRNRDSRLYFTVLPPYKVIVGSPNYTWTKTSNTADAEYINIMASLTGPIDKQLPMYQWSNTMATGTVISTSPHFRVFNAGQPQAVSELGYLYWKNYNRHPLDSKNNSTTDCPLFRIEEVWLNYAEAMFELGTFNQSIANQTINKLRTRTNLPPMTVSDITTGFDPKRDLSVDPILWEIRRERRVELMGDGFRFNDIKRWKKGSYLNREPTGVRVNNAEFGNKLKIVGGSSIGYVTFFGPTAGWLNKYYIEPIPTQERVLNDKLDQSPDW
ncbi:RagB/SusD family nutrient uptake outer membrane protein [Pedobacter sp. MW01-1-1]|uniref:RagB/SusD family nutrient uptake outer membrane protein n=1 Tax=Pedobacter sp. MW01-1-1 TaxID=3383027 RepID=UPI003FEFD9F1